MGEPAGITVWQGSVFNCVNHEINLFHNQYETIEGAHGECGGISGQSVRTTVTTNDNNSTTYYTSQLTVPTSSGTEGKTIQCLYDNGATSMTVGKARISFTISTVYPNDNN
jgi:hypothetical protein